MDEIFIKLAASGFFILAVTTIIGLNTDGKVEKYLRYLAISIIVLICVCMIGWVWTAF